MQTLLIVIAIFSSIVLLVKFAAPHAVPHFSPSDRLSDNAVVWRVRLLGKRCAVTEKGFGIGRGAVRVRRVLRAALSAVEGGTAQYWQYELVRHKTELINAFESSKIVLRASAYCGHVRRYPRIYLLCESIVTGSDCNVTTELFCAALSAFEENSVLTAEERRLLPRMLKFCTVGSLFAAAELAQKRDDSYKRGLHDGKNGKADLDCIADDDYVCGLCDGVSGDELKSVITLLEYNSVDINAARLGRKIFLSKMYARVKSSLRTFFVADSYSGYTALAIAEKRAKTAPERYVKFFNIAIPTLILLYSVFTCIFATQSYVALFAVASIITYCVLRIPVLLHSPASNLDMPNVGKWLIGLFSKDTDTSKTVPRSAFMSEIAYFGGEPQYIFETVKGAELAVTFDNRGDVKIKDTIKNRSYRYAIFCVCDGHRIDLASCDGAIERHKCVYRTAAGSLDFAAELVLSVDYAAVVARITIVNRSAEKRTLNLESAVLLDRGAGTNCYCEYVSNGAISVAGNTSMAMSVGDGGIYGNNLYEYLHGGRPVCGVYGRPAIIGSAELTLEPFGKAVRNIAVALGSGNRELNGTLGYVADGGYFDLAVDRARAFFGKDRTTGSSFSGNYEPENKIPTETNIAEYDMPDIPYSATLLKRLYGVELASDGARTVCGDANNLRCADNVLGGAGMLLRTDGNGISGMAYNGRKITAEYDLLRGMPPIFAAIGENGVIWSPTYAPFGRGRLAVTDGPDYTEYTCAYNGTVCRLRCFSERKSSTAVFEVTVKNTQNVRRNLDIMLSLICVENAEVKCLPDSVCAEIDGVRFKLFAVGERNVEFSEYKEGYYIRGKVDRLRGFRGGVTPAPTVSVAKSFKPNSEHRIVFCVEAGDNAASADNLHADCSRVRLGRIALASNDTLFDCLYNRALYVAYEYGAIVGWKSLSVRDKCFVLGAVKHVNIGAAKRRIIAMLSEQLENGRIGDRPTDGIFLAHCVVDLAEFTGDSGFLYEEVPFFCADKSRNAGVPNATVAEHCLRAAEFAVRNCDLSAIGGTEGLYVNRLAIDVFGYLDGLASKIGAPYARHTGIVTACAELWRTAVNNLKSIQVGGTAIDRLIGAVVLYRLGYNDAAYALYDVDDVKKRIILKNDAAVSALYYTIVTELTMGIRFCGSRVYINPRTASATPHIEFYLLGKTHDCRIVIDDSERIGNWKMRVNKISYSAEGTDISNSANDIVFYRDGKE